MKKICGIWLLVLATFFSCKADPHDKISHEIWSYSVVYEIVFYEEKLGNKARLSRWHDLRQGQMASILEYNFEMPDRHTAEQLLMLDLIEGYYVFNLRGRTGRKGRYENEMDYMAGLIAAGQNQCIESFITGKGGAIIGAGEHLGKNCLIAGLPHADPYGWEVLTRVWYYRGIPLKVTTEYMTMEAISVDLNITIPPGLFSLPEGINISIIH